MKRAWLAVVIAPVVAGTAAGQTREELAAEVFPILEKGCRSGDMMVRARAVEAMARVPGRDVAPYIQDGLNDAQWVVRVAAVKALARLGRPEAKTLAEEWLRMSDFPHESLAFDLVSALPAGVGQSLVFAAVLDPASPAREGLFKAVLAQEPPVIASLFSAGLGKAGLEVRLVDIPEDRRVAVATLLVQDRDPAVQAAALRWVRTARLDLPAATLQPLLKSKSPEVRLGVAETLALNGDGSALAFLSPLLDGPREDQLRYLWAAAAARPLSADVTSRLKKFLAPDTPEDLLIPVYLAFAGTDDPALRSRVEEDIQSTLLPRRAAATRALPRLLGNRALPRLYELLRDGNPLIRRLAAEGIGDLGQAESVEVLERALRDTERDVRLAVVEALGRIHDRSVAGVASFVVYDTDPAIRKAAIRAVCRVNHADALPILRIYAEDPDPEVRYDVLRAMIEVDPATAREYLDRALAGLEPRHLLALAGKFGEAFLPFLKDAASSSRAWTRLAAVQAAALLPGIEVAFLQELVATNPHADVRKAAVQALGRRSCPEALTAAQALVKDANFDVRLGAVEVLVRCGDGQVMDTLRGLFLDPDEVVRVAAAAGLLEFPKAPPGKAPPPRKKGR